MIVVMAVRLPVCKSTVIVTGICVEARAVSKGAPGGMLCIKPIALTVASESTAPTVNAVKIITVAVNAGINKVTAASTFMPSDCPIDVATAVEVMCVCLEARHVTTRPPRMEG